MFEKCPGVNCHGEKTSYGFEDVPIDDEELMRRMDEIEHFRKAEIARAKSYEDFEKHYLEREVAKLYEDMDAFAKLGFAPEK